ARDRGSPGAGSARSRVRLTRGYREAPQCGRGNGEGCRSWGTALPSSAPRHKAALCRRQFTSYSAHPSISAAATMRSFLILGTALMLAAPVAPAVAAVSDFRLPPPPSENQPPPDQQGPVAPDVPESRPTPAPSPTARAPSPAPTAAPPIVIPPRLETPTPASAPTAAPAPAPRATATAAPVPASEAPADPAPTPVPEGAEATPSPLPTFS